MTFYYRNKKKSMTNNTTIHLQKKRPRDKLKTVNSFHARKHEVLSNSLYGTLTKAQGHNCDT